MVNALFAISYCLLPSCAGKRRNSSFAFQDRIGFNATSELGPDPNSLSLPGKKHVGSLRPNRQRLRNACCRVYGSAP